MISVKVNVCVSKRTIYGIVQAPLSHFKFCKGVYHKISLCQLDCDECVFVKYSQNIKGQPPLSVKNIIESGAFMTMDTVPKNQRVYKSCIYPVACNIIVMYTSMACDTIAKSYLQNLKLMLLKTAALICKQRR